MLLLTIAPSHYCEKARLGLLRAGFAVEERAHAPIFHVLPLRRATGRTTTPALRVGDAWIQDSTEILRWIEAQPSATWRPYAGLPDALPREERVDEVVGPAARRVAYFHLLSDLAKTRSLAQAWPVGLEAKAFAWSAPLMATLLRRGLNVTPPATARSLDKLTAFFEEVSGWLADGRPWLAGDRFSAADLALGTLSAPVLLPDGHPRLPSLADAPPSLAAVAQTLRATPAGAHALRAWAESGKPA